MAIKTHRPYSWDFSPCDFWLFPKLRGCRYETNEEMKEVVIDTSMGPSRTVEQVHCSRWRLLWRGLELYVCTINKSGHTKKSLETYLMILVYIYIYIYNWNSEFHVVDLDMTMAETSNLVLWVLFYQFSTGVQLLWIPRFPSSRLVASPKLNNPICLTINS